MYIPEHYKDRREEGENVLRQCQLAQLHLLHVIDEVCKKNNIKYFLHGGTLLGAIRHNGFIPWDDDLDIGMPMKDYKKFLKVAPECFPKDVFLQDPKNYAHISLPFAKVRDANSFYLESAHYMRTQDPAGIYVDVFPFEKMPKIGFRAQQFLLKCISSPWMRQRWFLSRAADHIVISPILAVLAILCSITSKLFRGLANVLRATLPCEDYYIIFERCDTCQFKIEWFEPLVQHKFEDAEFPVPRNYDACLRASYKDWHWIPPPENRPRHARIIDPFHAAHE